MIEPFHLYNLADLWESEASKMLSRRSDTLAIAKAEVSRKHAHTLRRLAREWELRLETEEVPEVDVLTYQRHACYMLMRKDVTPTELLLAARVRQVCGMILKGGTDEPEQEKTEEEAGNNRQE